MPDAHAYLPPSGAADWLACSKWPEMQRLYPDTGDDEASRAGTAAHWAGAEMIHGRVVAEGQITPDNTVLDQEMIDSAEVWARDVLRTLHTGTTRPVHGSTFGVEQHLPAALHPQNWGTPDTWYWDTNAGVLHVWDFKHGHGIVDEWQNWQLINYAALLAAMLQLPATTQLRLTVIQPRAFHRGGARRTWRTTLAELAPLVDRLTLAAEDATAPNPTARPSAACTHCSGRHACEALQRDAYRSADLALASTPLDLGAEAAGTELALLGPALKRLKARIDGLEQQLQAQIEAGHRSSRWILERVPGREGWKVPVESVEAIGLAAGVPLVRKQPLTPTQAKAAGCPEWVLTDYTERKTSIKLVPFEGSATSRMFTS